MSREYASNPAELPRGTLVGLFLEAVERFGDAPAFRHHGGGGWREVSYREAGRTASEVAAALGALGLERGDRAGLLSENRVEWALTDYGALLAGVRIVPVYATLTPREIRHLLTDSGARAVFVSDREQLEKIRAIRSDCPELERIVVFDPPEDPDAGGTAGGGGTGDGPGGGTTETSSWDELLATGRTALGSTSVDELLERARSAEPDEMATMLYTSGTTGPPKGVVLTHQNLFSNVKACERVLPLGPDDETLSILPLSHVLQRMVDYLFFSQGCTISYPRSRETIPEDMRSRRPTVMVAVPRVYEKVYNRVMEERGLRAKLVQWAREVGAAWAAETLAGRKPSAVLRLVYGLADRVVFRKIREGVGGRVRFFVSGGGPLSPEINRFFYSVGLLILEGYGLTETSPVTNVNTPEDFRIGTVGRPVPGTEVRIGEKNEIQVRGPQVMKGYFGMPDATREAIDEEGWFRTGDVGEIDDDGFLRVTDRLKDLIITSGGKNIAPQPIENLLKKNRFVEQAVMVGDGRKFASILVVPSFTNLEAWARERGLAFGDRSELLGRPEVLEMMRTEIYGELGDLARYEMPKKVGLLAEELTVEGGALTPTEKVKRRVVEERYRDLIDSFYTEEAVDRTMFVAGQRAESRGVA